ncbi:hypothetical protein SARC_01813, partial [Sphaeroforma arctica JP610]
KNLTLLTDIFNATFLAKTLLLEDILGWSMNLKVIFVPARWGSRLAAVRGPGQLRTEEKNNSGILKRNFGRPVNPHDKDMKRYGSIHVEVTISKAGVTKLYESIIDTLVIMKLDTRIHRRVLQKKKPNTGPSRQPRQRSSRWGLRATLLE